MRHVLHVRPNFPQEATHFLTDTIFNWAPTTQLQRLPLTNIINLQLSNCCRPVFLLALDTSNVDTPAAILPVPERSTAHAHNRITGVNSCQGVAVQIVHIAPTG